MSVAAAFLSFLAVNIFRKALKDVTLSDGTRIPKGTLVAAAAVTAHSDDASYPDPAVFDPFRFARLREGGLEAATRHQIVHTSVDFITFGGGKHAWSVPTSLPPSNIDHLGEPHLGDDRAQLSAGG